MKKIYSLMLLCLAGIVVAGCSAFSSKDYKACVKEGDYEKAHEILGELHEDYFSIEKRYGNEDFARAKDAYFNALNFIYENEIREIIASGSDCTDKVVFLISEIPVDGEKATEGLCDYNFASDAAHGDLFTDGGLPLSRYLWSVQAINKICDKALNLAVNQKNKDLAGAIIDQYKDDVEITTGSSTSDIQVDSIRVDGNHGYIKYTQASKDAAIAKMAAAFPESE